MTTLPFASPELARTLDAHAARMKATSLRAMLESDPGRFPDLSVEAAGLLLDYSRQLVDADVLKALDELAVASKVEAWRDAMLRGDVVNNTENRPALHTALRDPSTTPLMVSGVDVRAQVREERRKCREFVAAVVSGAKRGATGERFTDVINIGIGGSDLGPVMAVEALKGYATTGLKIHFVSNVDGVQMADLAATLDPKKTLVIICSKTFTTSETLSNARLCRAWVADALGEAAVPTHFAAVSVNHPAMNEFGVSPDARFSRWDWVGGRYSMWSAIGISIELAIGTENFEALLSGAHAMDEHFKSAPLEQNLPVRMAQLAVWNRNYLEAASLAILPYDQRLHRLPAYLQQLCMESNGKHVQRDGTPTAWATEPVIWGEPGNNGQHSFFQLLHQGSDRIALDFMIPARSSVGNREAQDLAIANGLAQAQAFALGHSVDEARAELVTKGLTGDALGTMARHKVHQGGRPLNVLVFDQLAPAKLGSIVAAYEHKIFAESVLWNINPFDQWGVELGKKLAEQILPFIRGRQRVQNFRLLDVFGALSTRSNR